MSNTNTNTKITTIPEGLPHTATAIADDDTRITSIVVYPDGWVSNSYKWPKNGRKLTYVRNSNGQWEKATEGKVNMRRSYGEGPLWVGFSEKGGRLASGSN